MIKGNYRFIVIWGFLTLLTLAAIGYYFMVPLIPQLIRALEG